MARDPSNGSTRFASAEKRQRATVSVDEFTRLAVFFFFSFQQSSEKRRKVNHPVVAFVPVRRGRDFEDRS